MFYMLFMWLVVVNIIADCYYSMLLACDSCMHSAVVGYRRRVCLVVVLMMLQVLMTETLMVWSFLFHTALFLIPIVVLLPQRRLSSVPCHRRLFHSDAYRTVTRWNLVQHPLSLVLRQRWMMMLGVSLSYHLAPPVARCSRDLYLVLCILFHVYLLEFARSLLVVFLTVVFNCNGCLCFSGHFLDEPG